MKVPQKLFDMREQAMSEITRCRREIELCEVSLAAINTAVAVIEAEPWPIELPEDEPARERAPRRNIRALVHKIVRDQAWPKDRLDAASIAAEIGCRRSQAEAALAWLNGTETHDA